MLTEGDRGRSAVRGARAIGWRGLLGCTTALTALALLQPARAQAPLATPMGGSVVAGSASIAQAPGATTITQGTSRAAINWQSFDVGSKATVTFHQPSRQAVTLNRVLAPDPSTIAGHINANGSIVLVNPNGIVFAHGAEVNAAGLIASAPGITNKNFMAGRMVFNQPANPNAHVVNQGTITIGQAGLAALVAPTVANSGVIAAKLGSVVLAGAKTATLDLYGDGLVSIDVAGAVQTVPVGPDGKPVKALVTNSGTIVAEGGRVLLTAQAVDGLIQNLVDAGGTISADGGSGKPAGTVLVQGVGGSISIPGTLMARGEGSQGTGGAIGLDATGGVAVQKTARIDASGPAGGGVVAVGTTLARARGGPGTPAGLTAKNVGIAPGATISADATAAGNGGRVVVLSSAHTADHGAITAKGGPAGGDGGFVEISGHDLSLDGTVNTAAPLGVMGTILLDPFDLDVVAGSAGSGSVDGDFAGGTLPESAGGNTSGTSTITAATIEGFTDGSVLIQAANNITVETSVTLGAGQAITFQAGNDVTVASGAKVTAPGGVTVDAASIFNAGTFFGTDFTKPGGIIINGTLSVGGADSVITLNAGTGGIAIGSSGLVDGGPAAAPAGALFVFTSGPFTETGNGAINAAFVSTPFIEGGQPNVASASLNGPNSIGTIGFLEASAGGISLSDTFPSLAIFTMSAPDTETIKIAADRIPLADSEAFISAGTVALGPYHDGVPITLEGGNADPATGFALNNNDYFSINAPTLELVQPGAAPIIISGANTFGGSGNAITTLAFATGGPVSEDATGSVSVQNLTGAAGSVSLNNADNNILNLGNFTTAGSFSLVDSPVDVDGLASPLTVNGTVESATGVTLDVINGGISIGSATAGLISAPGVTLDAANSGILIGSFTARGSISSSGTVDLIASAAIEEPQGNGGSINGAVTAGTLTGSAGEVFLPGSNAIGALGSFTFNTAFLNELVLNDDVSLNVAGPVNMPVAAFVSLASSGDLTVSGTIDAVTGNVFPLLATLVSGGNLVLSGVVNATGGTVTVIAGGSITEPGGAVLADTLSGSSGGAALFTGVNAIGTLAALNSLESGMALVATPDPPPAAFTAGGDFTLVDSAPLTITAPITVPTGHTIALVTDSLTEGSQTIFTDVGSLTVFGALQAPGGEVSIAPFTASVPVALVDGGTQPAGTLAIDDALLAAITAGTLALTSFGTEPITISGANQLGGLTDPNTGAASGVSALLVKAGGALLEAAGATLNVGTLTGSAGSVALGGANVIPTLGPFSSTGGFELTDATGLTVLGNVTDPTGITLEVTAGNLAVGTASTFGQIASAGTVNLQVPNGSITVPNGQLQAGTLTGVASGLASLGTAHVLTLGSFSVSGAAGELALTNNAPLTITGPVSAAFLDIAAPGTLTLAGNIFTTGLPLADQSGAAPSLPGSVLEVLSGGVFQELGTSVIAPLGGGGAVVRIQLPAEGGAATFADLLAGGANLVLALGPGVASGTMAAGGLLVLGTGGSANLFGTVAGIPGGAAAGAARIQPHVSTNYLFNGCVIQTTVCSALLTQVPQGTPNIVATGGGPSLSPGVSLPEIVLFTIPAVIGENWTDAGGFPLPNIARLDF